ncbi:hypothetical protein KK423_03645 [Clostridioides difficile]|nr:hypothetical protein [Clostridioides difficile]
MFEKYKNSRHFEGYCRLHFVDEYQDTSPLVADILLKHLEQSSKKNVIGFWRFNAIYI